MKTTIQAAALILALILLAGCDTHSDDQPAALSSIDLINTEFPEAKQELVET